jgi:hypothetical protein
MCVRPSLLPALVVLASSCSSIADPGPNAYGSLMVANATNGSLDVDVDGHRRVDGLSMNATTYWLAAAAGLRTVRLVPFYFLGGAIEVPVEISAEKPQTLVVYPTLPIGATPGIAATVLANPTEFTPSGKSDLRVANLSTTAGDAQVWRRAPDLPAGDPITTPFSFGAVSPYLRSDAGVWEVWLASPAGAKLLSTGPIQIPSGQRRTVLVVDTEGGPRLVVMDM